MVLVGTGQGGKRTTFRENRCIGGASGDGCQVQLLSGIGVGGH